MRALPSLHRAIGVAAVSLLLLPAAAAAAPDAAQDDEPEHEAANSDAAQNDASEQEAGENDAAGNDAANSCDDLLVTFTRDATTGDDKAVAITAQSIERGAPGWELVGWETTPGTQLTAVLATDRAGETLHLGADTTGFAEQVTSLTFCGTTADVPDDRTEAGDSDGADGAGPDIEVDDSDHTDASDHTDGTDHTDASDDTDGTDHTDGADEVVVDPPAGSSQQEPNAGDAHEPATATGSTTASAAPQTPVDEPGTPADTAVPTGQGEGQGEGDATGTSDATDPAEEVEVLGVRIVATPEVEDDADDTDDTVAQELDEGAAGEPAVGPAFEAATLGTDRGLLDSAWLLAAAIAAGIVAGGSAIRYRRTAAANPAGSDRSAATTSMTVANTGTGTNTGTDTITSTDQPGENHR